jgi:hypothetical protein
MLTFFFVAVGIRVLYDQCRFCYWVLLKVVWDDVDLDNECER